MIEVRAEVGKLDSARVYTRVCVWKAGWKNITIYGLGNISVSTVSIVM